MLIPILFFPALLVCNDAFPDEVVEDPPDDPPVTTAGTTVTAVTVEREPLGKVVVKTRVDVLLLVVTVAFVGVSSAGEAGLVVVVGVETGVVVVGVATGVVVVDVATGVVVVVGTTCDDVVSSVVAAREDDVEI